jgi:hypothetical protein
MAAAWDRVIIQAKIASIRPCRYLRRRLRDGQYAMNIPSSSQLGLRCLEDTVMSEEHRLGKPS